MICQYHYLLPVLFSSLLFSPTPELDKVARFDWVLPDIDAWAIQLYRGFSFGGYFGKCYTYFEMHAARFLCVKITVISIVYSTISHHITSHLLHLLILHQHTPHYICKLNDMI